MLWYSKAITIEPEHRFIIDWPLMPQDSFEELAAQPMIRVEFLFTPEGDGTRLTIAESGFNNLPDTDENRKAYADNIEGWKIQHENIRAYVET